MRAAADIAYFLRELFAILFLAFAGMYLTHPPRSDEPQLRAQVAMLERHIRIQQADTQFALNAANLCLHSIPFRVGRDLWLPQTEHATLTPNAQVAGVTN